MKKQGIFSGYDNVYVMNKAVGRSCERRPVDEISEQNEVKKQGAIRSEGASSATMFLRGQGCICSFGRAWKPARTAYNGTTRVSNRSSPLS